MRRKTILISGRSGVGKDTFANELAKQLEDKGYNCLILHNADPAKFILEAEGITNYKTPEGKKAIMDVTNFCYGLDPYYFENYMEERLKQFQEQYDEKVEFLIIPDWRYVSTFIYHMFTAFTIFLTRPETSYDLGKIAKQKEQKLLSEIEPFVHTKLELKGLDQLKNQVGDYIAECLHIV